MASSAVNVLEASSSPGSSLTTPAASPGHFHSSCSTEASSNRQSALDARCSAASAVFAAVDTEFYESEVLYLGALETLWLAYLQPLINAQHSSAVGDKRDANSALLETTFGADVQAMIACHRNILDSFHQSASSLRGSSSASGSRGLSQSEVGSAAPTSDQNNVHFGDREISNRVSNNLDDVCSETTDSFPVILLRMTPTMTTAYSRYVSNFSKNLAAAQAVRDAVPKGLWKVSYESLARMTLQERVRPWFASSDDELGNDNNIGATGHGGAARPSYSSGYIDNVLMSYSTDFSALVTLPVQRIARYSLMIKEWVKCHADETNLEMFSSPSRRCQMEVNQMALDAAERMHEICAAVDEIRSAIESTQRLMTLETRLGVSHAGLSQHEGMSILHDSSVTKAKPKGKGVWHMKPSYAILLTRMLVVVECTDESRRKCKRMFRVPLQAILDVRRLSSEPKWSKEMNGAHGLIVRFTMLQTKEKGFLARLTSSLNQSQTETTEEVLVLLDDDPANIDIWVHDISSQVMQCTA